MIWDTGANAGSVDSRRVEVVQNQQFWEVLEVLIIGWLWRRSLVSVDSGGFMGEFGEIVYSVHVRV